MGKSKKVYVVSSPTDIRGIYDTWEECKAVVHGRRRAKFMGVRDRVKAEAILGDGIALPPGLYAFTDGNDAGGVGVVIVDVLPGIPFELTEHSTTVHSVFAEAGIDGLEDREAIDDALASFKNILAELAGLYHALELVPSRTTSTIVHDYEGIGAWMEGRWKTRKPVTGAIVTSCHDLVRSKELKVSFRRQRGHQSSWAGRDDWAYYNQRADACATAADESTRSGKAWGE